MMPQLATAMQPLAGVTRPSLGGMNPAAAYEDLHIRQ